MKEPVVYTKRQDAVLKRWRAKEKKKADTFKTWLAKYHPPDKLKA